MYAVTGGETEGALMFGAPGGYPEAQGDLAPARAPGVVAHLSRGGPTSVPAVLLAGGATRRSGGVTADLQGGLQIVKGDDAEGAGETGGDLGKCEPVGVSGFIKDFRIQEGGHRDPRRLTADHLREDEGSGEGDALRGESGVTNRPLPRIKGIVGYGGNAVEAVGNEAGVPAEERYRRRGQGEIDQGAVGGDRPVSESSYRQTACGTDVVRISIGAEGELPEQQIRGIRAVVADLVVPLQVGLQLQPPRQDRCGGHGCGRRGPSLLIGELTGPQLDDIPFGPRSPGGDPKGVGGNGNRRRFAPIQRPYQGAANEPEKGFSIHRGACGEAARLIGIDVLLPGDANGVPRGTEKDVAEVRLEAAQLRNYRGELIPSNRLLPSVYLSNIDPRGAEKLRRLPPGDPGRGFDGLEKRSFLSHHREAEAEEEQVKNRNKSHQGGLLTSILCHVRNILRPIQRRAGVWAILLTAIVAVPVLNLLGWFETAEHNSYDGYLLTLPSPEADPRIQIIGIDDRAIAVVGEWPWSRSVIADGLATLGEFDPEAVLLDIEFSEESPYLVERRRWEELRQQFPEGVPTGRLESLLTDRDRLLAETIAAVGSVVIPATIEERAEITLRRALPAIRAAAAGEGFSNIEIDRDGVMRRVALLRRVGGQRLPQLALETAGADLADEEELRFDSTGHLVDETVSVELPDGRSVTVPLSGDGTTLIRWPEEPFGDAYPQISWATLIEYQEAMADLEFNLRLMDEAGYLDERSASVLQTADSAAETLSVARSRGEEQLFDEYRRLRQAFVALAGGVLQGGAEQRILDDLDRVAGEDAPPEIAEQVAAIRADVEETFAATRGIYEEVERLRRFFEDRLPDSLSLVGYTATSTIDLGVTPFDESFPNLGVHAALVSMLRGGDFVDAVGWPVAWLLGTVWLLVAVFLVTRLSGTYSLIAGGAAILLPPLASLGILHALRIYVPALSMTIPAAVGAVAFILRDYVSALQDRLTIRKAFEHYLAPAVISELVEHPERLGVGGEEAELTALFTDIAGFSRVSEILGTREIVSLLNQYLTEMSDVILDHRGTIDKYEGDAVMAFFGAPVADESHAEHACRAAIQMKKVEGLLNDRLVRAGTAPQPLHTRIGINSGEMIVGNLGTTRRLNYTVMGPAVNLAARLESVNKQYGTYICVSEETYNRLPEGFLFRRMDRVRVQGIDDPVRLYELVGYREEASAPLREALDIFALGLGEFEQGAWEEARHRFETVLRIYPDDGPARLFIERCREFETEPPRDTWDGVISLSRK